MKLDIHIDASALSELMDLDRRAIDTLEKAAAKLAKMTHEKVEEIAKKKLHSRLSTYLENLEMIQEDGVWIIRLGESAQWIEDGQTEWEMVDALLQNASKTAKDGTKYAVIPFEKGPGKKLPASERSLVTTLQRTMQRRKTPWSRVEVDDSGVPKTGRLHTFDILRGPIKTHEGPGQGKGPIGEVVQGRTGTPFLERVGVYQTPKLDKFGNVGVDRSVVTFRTVSEKHRGTGMWVHPGLEPVNIIDEAYEWALEEWDRNLGPKAWNKILK